MKLFIGLGNPDKKYENTRHNVGHLLISRLPPSKSHLKSDNYMNESGIFVQKQIHFYKIEPSSLYLIHDDLDLPVGEWRLQFDRSPAGHHGVESVIEHLGTQAFWRIRIGIGKPKKIPVEKYVLQPFSTEEKKKINEVIDTIIGEIENLGS